MKKLKIILKYNILLFLSIVFSLIIVNTYKTNSKYRGNERIIYGHVREIKNTDKLILTVKAKEKVLVYYDKNINIEFNDYIIVKGKLVKPKSNTNFNMFDYRKYLNSKKINYIMYADSIKIKQANRNIIYRIKNIINNRINRCKSKDYLNVFIMGNKNNIDYETKNIYKNLGIIHLLSISGTYIALMILFLKKIRIQNRIIIPLLIIYIIFTNFQISIIRSSICYILFVINDKYNFGFTSKEIIKLLSSFLLFINPFFINDIGYLLSFIISYSLIHFNYLYKNKKYFFKLLIISTISFLVSMPIIINTNYSINFLSIIYNIIYVPYASFILFPMSIITFIFPVFDNVLVLMINIFEKISVLLNYIKIFTFSFSKIPILLIIIYYYLLFNKRNYFLFMIIIFFFYNYYLFTPRIYFFDVGQGDSALIRFKNKNILIDTGRSYKYDYSDNYISMFKSLGVKKIDYLFISHGDLDHIGNSLKYIKKIRIDRVYINKYKLTDLEKELCKYKCKKVGDEDIIKINNIKFYILNPKYDMSDENDNSLVINFSINNRNILFMGDSSKNVEDRLINEYDIGKIDILKVGHHGSKTSSSIEFINEIKPKYSIISVGKNNRYGHPNKEVLDNLYNSKVYRTDLDGSIMFKIKNNKLKIETCSP